MILGRASTLPCNRMGVVKTDQARAVGAMHGQALVEAMGLVGRCGHLMYDRTSPSSQLR